MAKMGSINVTLEDYKGKTGRVTVDVPIAQATTKNAKKVADFLKGKSDAAVKSYGVTKDYDDKTGWLLGDTGKYDRCLQRLQINFEDENGKSRTFGIPAPKDGAVSADQEPDSDLPEDVKDLLIEIKAVTEFTYNGGGLKSRMGSKESRSKEMTGV
jgi:hypothetical protein